MCGAKNVKNILKRELARVGIGEEVISGMREYEMMALLSWMLSHTEEGREEIIKKAAECALLHEHTPPSYLNLLKVF